MNLLDHLKTSGLNPIYIDENTDIGEALMGSKNKRETNEEFIVRIMNFGCPTGALIQPFIIEALSVAAHRFSKEPIPDGGLIDPEVWMETAQWLKSELEKKYGSSR